MTSTECITLIQQNLIQPQDKRLSDIIARYYAEDDMDVIRALQKALISLLDAYEPMVVKLGFHNTDEIKQAHDALEISQGILKQKSDENYVSVSCGGKRYVPDDEIRTVEVFSDESGSELCVSKQGFGSICVSLKEV